MFTLIVDLPPIYTLSVEPALNTELSDFVEPEDDAESPVSDAATAGSGLEGCVSSSPATVHEGNESGRQDDEAYVFPYWRASQYYTHAVHSIDCRERNESLQTDHSTFASEQILCPSKEIAESVYIACLLEKKTTDCPYISRPLVAFGGEDNIHCKTLDMYAFYVFILYMEMN